MTRRKEKGADMRSPRVPTSRTEPGFEMKEMGLPAGAPKWWNKLGRRELRKRAYFTLLKNCLCVSFLIAIRIIIRIRNVASCLGLIDRENNNYSVFKFSFGKHLVQMLATWLLFLFLFSVDCSLEQLLSSDNIAIANCCQRSRAAACLI